MRKPAWIGKVDAATVISPAAVIELADWWDAWRLMWLGIGTAGSQHAIIWESTYGT